MECQHFLILLLYSYYKEFYVLAQEWSFSIKKVFCMFVSSFPICFGTVVMNDWKTIFDTVIALTLFSMIINQPIWLRLGQNFSWLLYYFAYVNAFPWWHHRFLFKILAVIVLSLSTELIIFSEFITTRLKTIELRYVLSKNMSWLPFLFSTNF